jgi:putative acetyltransferase
VVGGAGIFPTENLPNGTCELVKLYLHKDARGTGLGKELLNTAMQWAKENGYTQVYLESMPELSKAVTIYENVGFKRIDQPLGNSGHCGCDIWMIKNL